MVDVLDIVVVLHDIDHLLHVLDVLWIGEGDVVLGHHLHLGGGEGVALLLHGRHHGGEGVGISVDGEALLFGLEVSSAAVQSVHHHHVLVQVLPLDDEHALLVKGPGHAAGGTQVATELIEVVAHLGGSAVTVVGEGLHDDGHAAGTVSLIGNGLVVVGVAGAQGLLNGTLDVVVGHVGRTSLGNDGGQTGVVVGVAAAAGLHGHDQLTGDLGKGLRALGVCRVNIKIS